MKKLQFLKNKIFIKWVKYNIIVIIISVSVILNIIYLPKYFSGQNNNNQNVTTISLEAINTTNKSVERVLTKTTYITTFKTLGNLLNACTNQFKLKNFSTMNLHYLYGVANDKGTMIDQNDNKNWWQVELWNDSHFVQTKMGIDDTLLTNNNRFRFELTVIA